MTVPVQQNNHNCNDVKVADHVDTVNINNKETVPLSLIEYILIYLLVNTTLGLVFLFGMAIYAAKTISGGSTINQNAIMHAIQVDHSWHGWDIIYVVFGLFITLVVAGLHWFIKITNCSDCPYRIVPLLKSKVALGN